MVSVRCRSLVQRSPTMCVTRHNSNPLRQNKYEEETRKKKERTNSIWCVAQIMKLLSSQFSPVPCYLHPLCPDVFLSTPCLTINQPLCSICSLLTAPCRCLNKLVTLRRPHTHTCIPSPCYFCYVLLWNIT
jgi:hypothetical protein